MLLSLIDIIIISRATTILKGVDVKNCSLGISIAKTYEAPIAELSINLLIKTFFFIVCIVIVNKNKFTKKFSNKSISKYTTILFTPLKIII